jgi:hypothetical protein
MLRSRKRLDEFISLQDTISCKSQELEKALEILAVVFGIRLSEVD